ncbi:unnamed protein product [Linum trigynum]|uniref:Uncharacterized protein n=1 Tax=Linum trigynum TaxID=586398 RepID=A0AAV2EH04_9ROSI
MAALVLLLSIFLLLLTMTMATIASFEEEDPYKWGCRDGHGRVNEETAATTMQAILDNMVTTLPYRREGRGWWRVSGRREGEGRERREGWTADGGKGVAVGFAYNI